MESLLSGVSGDARLDGWPWTYHGHTTRAMKPAGRDAAGPRIKLPPTCTVQHEEQQLSWRWWRARWRRYCRDTYCSLLYSPSTIGDEQAAGGGRS